jgi:hypothetical protein
MMNVILISALCIGCFIIGLLFKKLVVDKLKVYVFNKLKPIIINKYLEEMLGLNIPVPVPAVVVVPVGQVPPSDGVLMRSVPAEPVVVDQVIEG